MEDSSTEEEVTIADSLEWADDKFFLTQAQLAEKEKSGEVPAWLVPYKEGIRLYCAMQNKEFVQKYPQTNVRPEVLRRVSEFTVQEVNWDIPNQCFQKALDAGCPMAAIWLDDIALLQDKKRVKIELESISALATAGVADAQYAFGYYFFQQFSLADQKRTNTIQDCFLKAAEQGYPLAGAALLSFYVVRGTWSQSLIEGQGEVLSNLKDLTDPVIFSCNVAALQASQTFLMQKKQEAIQTALSLEQVRVIKEKRWTWFGVIGGWLANPLGLPLLFLAAGCLAIYLNPLSSVGVGLIETAMVFGLIIAPLGLVVSLCHWLAEMYTDYQEQKQVDKDLGFLKYGFFKLPSRLLTWMANHRLQTLIVLAGVCVTTLLMAAILMFGNQMYPALDVMRKALFDALTYLSGIPGLEFLSPLATAAVTEILTLVFALLGPLILADALRRIVNTYEIYTKPSAEYTCKNEDLDNLPLKGSINEMKLGRVLYDVSGTKDGADVFFRRNELLITRNNPLGQDEPSVCVKRRDLPPSAGNTILLPKDSVCRIL
jgi:hypothetical protein